MKLTFTIPTYGRPTELAICIKSIAEQIAKEESDANGRREDYELIEILVIDNGADSDTAAVIDNMSSRYSFVRSIRFEDNPDYSVAHRRYMQAAPESKWVWTFGDDDILMPGALKFMLEQLDRLDVRFIHVAEVSRSTTNGCYKGKLLDLCNTYGWLEMTGFMTGNIIRGSLLYGAATTPRWDCYAKSAFVHSCALLEYLKDFDAAFLDLPLINTQNKEQTQECLQKWIDQNIPSRYLYCAQAIDRMFEDGILTNKLPPKFFRYLTYHLWDRFIVHFCSDYLNQGTQWNEEAWSSVSLMLKHVSDEEVIQQALQDIEAARGMVTLHRYMSLNLEGIKQEINSLATRREDLIYPFTFINGVTVAIEGCQP